MWGCWAWYSFFSSLTKVKSVPKFLQLVSTKDQLFPLFVMQVMGDISCVPGLFVAGVFSGALSTVSSGLNSLAAVTLQDLMNAGCKVSFSEKVFAVFTLLMICPTRHHSPQKPKPSRTVAFPFQRSTWAAKGLAVGYGILSYLVVFLVKYLPGVLEVRVPSTETVIGHPPAHVLHLGCSRHLWNRGRARAGSFHPRNVRSLDELLGMLLNLAMSCIHHKVLGN